MSSSLHILDFFSGSSFFLNSESCWSRLLSRFLPLIESFPRSLQSLKTWFARAKLLPIRFSLRPLSSSSYSTASLSFMLGADLVVVDPFVEADKILGLGTFFLIIWVGRAISITDIVPSRAFYSENSAATGAFMGVLVWFYKLCSIAASSPFVWLISKSNSDAETSLPSSSS